MGVQAAVASGLGISLLPSDAILPEHRELGPEDGFDDQPASEIALVKGRAKSRQRLSPSGIFWLICCRSGVQSIALLACRRSQSRCPNKLRKPKFTGKPSGQPRRPPMAEREGNFCF